MVVKLKLVKLVKKSPEVNCPEMPVQKQAGVSNHVGDCHENVDFPPIQLGQVSISQLAHRSEYIYET